MQGRAVKKRVKGFDADVTTLSRIRTALKTDTRLDRNKVAMAIRTIDQLEDQLIELTRDLDARQSA